MERQSKAGQGETAIRESAARRPRWIVAVVLIWGLGLLAGTHVLATYEATPGPQAKAVPPALPNALRSDAHSQNLHLHLFVHPHCPCTAATQEELARALTATGFPSTAVHVRAFHPGATEATWTEGRLRAHALRNGWGWKGDEAGQLARQVGAFTSGTLVISRAEDGAILFHGGITKGRGHQGLNGGRGHVEDILRGVTTPGTYPVFGCPILVAEEAS